MCDVERIEMPAGASDLGYRERNIATLPREAYKHLQANVWKTPQIFDPSVAPVLEQQLRKFGPSRGGDFSQRFQPWP